ncbi:MAG: hypothetical protein V4731_05820 [Pseudomonadota bacterium]
MSYTLHCTKKLLARIKPPVMEGGPPSTNLLGNWYATAVFWKPQVALLVNEATLLPVLMPLAPASNLAERFPQHLALVLAAHGVAQKLIDHEVEKMREARHAKTASRSLLGMMNEFTFLAEVYRGMERDADLLTLAIKLSKTPCSPKDRGTIFPYCELQRVAGMWDSSNRNP